MATAYILNAFGKYETKDGTDGSEPGITLYCAGVPFWFPYDRVTPIPDWTFREVDHDKSTASTGERSVLRYKEENIPGHQVAALLTMNQVPVTNDQRGIRVIQGKATGRGITVPKGADAYGVAMEVEVMEREATRAELSEAREMADKYKRDTIAEYFQSKRERIAGGQGKLTPDKMTRIFMEELNVEDIDDVTTHQKATAGMDSNFLMALMEEMRKAGEVNAVKLREAVETVRRGEKAHFSKRPVSMDLKTRDEEWKAAHPDEVVK